MPAAEWLKSAVIHTPLEGPCRALAGLKDWAHARRHPELGELAREAGRIEALVRSVLRPDSNAVDVGSHLGSMLGLIVRCAPRGRHVAFEPVPRKARWLRRKFPGVDVREAAVGEAAGPVSFFVNTRRSGFSGLNPAGSPGEAMEELTIACERLDDVLLPGPAVALLKIDVEGCEWLALRGAERILARDRPVLIFESNPWAMAALGQTPADLFRHLDARAGYRIHLPKDGLHGADPLDLERFEAAQRYPFQAMNFVARPR